MWVSGFMSCGTDGMGGRVWGRRMLALREMLGTDASDIPIPISTAVWLNRGCVFPARES